jgi:hypothetical protein
LFDEDHERDVRDYAQADRLIFSIVRVRCVGRQQGDAMNEDALNTSVRRFLKKVGITSQREIEKAVRDAVASGRLKGNEALAAKVILTVGEVGVSLEIAGDIELE